MLTTPFVTFGGGLTLFGLNAGGVGITPTFSLNESDIRDLEHVTLAGFAEQCRGDEDRRALSHHQRDLRAHLQHVRQSPRSSATRASSRPSLLSTSKTSGLNLKATPVIHGNQDVTLKLELQLRSLGTQNVNGIPIINNREYTGNITVKNGESSVVTGLISKDDSRGINGYPFLGRVPGLNYASALHNKNVDDDELLVVITPHILRLPEQNSFVVELPSPR